MTTIEPTIFHKYLHEVFIFAQITQAKRKEIMEKRPKPKRKWEGEVKIKRVREQKNSDENHTELSSANR